MTPERWNLLQEFFYKAVDSDDETREEMIAECSALDPELGSELKILLINDVLTRSWEIKSPFNSLALILKSLANFDKPTLEVDPPDVAGFHLGRIVGQGSMGIVYLAEQTEPARQVALKVLKGTMEPTALARFTNEYYALALMKHSNIAQVYQAGLTMDGRPYFAMELVDGQSVTNYCDQNMLSIKERVGLFILVCDGILHAHQQGVIHQDIKPSNILITRQDQRAMPKIIDFGIAKKTEAHLSDATREHDIQNMIGTPAYMSPEQAVPDAIVDTRSDIYSLGAVLFELLTGSLLLSTEDFDRADYEEKISLIQKKKPIKPSQSVLQAHLPKAIAAARRTVPPKLIRELSGDLDSIVLRTLAPVKEDRYATVGELQQDLRAYLEHRPVLAAQHTWLYHLTKFWHRHKLGVLAVTTLLVTLCTMLALVTTLYLVTQKAKKVEHEALLQAQKSLSLLKAVNGFIDDLLISPNPNVLGPDAKVIDLLERAEIDLQGNLSREPEINASIRLTLAKSYYGLGLYEKAEAHLRLASSLLEHKNPLYATCLDLLARTLKRRDVLLEAEQVFQEALGLRLQYLGENHPDYLETMSGLANLRLAMGRLDLARQDYEMVLAQQQTFHHSLEAQARTLCGLANIYVAQGHNEDARVLYEKALQIQEAQRGPKYPQTMVTQNNLAQCLLEMNLLSEAEYQYRMVADRRAKVLGPNHPHTLSSLHGLARTLFLSNQLSEAQQLSKEVFEQRSALLGDSHSETLISANNYALILGRLGRLDEAAHILEGIISACEKTQKGTHPSCVLARNNLGDYLVKLGRPKEAITLLNETLARYEGHEDRRSLNTLCTLGEAYQNLGKLEHAESLFRRVIEEAQTQWCESPDQIAPYRVYLASCLGKQSRFEEAIQTLNAAEASVSQTDSELWRWIQTLRVELETGSLPEPPQGH